MEEKRVRVGKRQGEHTFLLMNLNGRRGRQRFMDMIRDLMEEGRVPKFSEVVASSREGHVGELLFVLPPSNDIDAVIGEIASATATRLRLKLKLRDMPPADYDAYAALLLMAHASVPRINPRLN